MVCPGRLRPRRGCLVSCASAFFHQAPAPDTQRACADPVSYTHLDVYKRQHFESNRTEIMKAKIIH